MSEKQENNKKKLDALWEKIGEKERFFCQNGRIIHFEKIWEKICLLQIVVSAVSDGGKS